MAKPDTLQWLLFFFAIIATAGIIIWRKSLPTIDRAGGDVVVIDGDLEQRDTWLYERAKEDSLRDVPWDGSTHPIFASVSQLKQTAMKLRADDPARLAFQYSAHRGETIAFVHREVRPAQSHQPDPSLASPLRDLAKAAYDSPGTHLVGIEAAHPDRWPTVILEKSPATK